MLYMSSHKESPPKSLTQISKIVLNWPPRLEL
jgi:hypothetical protein